MRNWLIKLYIHMEKRLKKISKMKMKKLHKLSWNAIIKGNVRTRFEEHLKIFTFQ